MIAHQIHDETAESASLIACERERESDEVGILAEAHAYNRRDFRFAIETVMRSIDLDGALRVIGERVNFALAAPANAMSEADRLAIYK
jgi:hypothetical protein